MSFFVRVNTQLLEASRYTLGLFVLTLVIAIPLGILVAACALSRFRPIRYATNTFIWIVRGTPLMLQIIVVMYGPGLLLGIPIKSQFLVAVIAFGINYAAYFAEIYRGGILSMPKGQYEAGTVLGLSRAQINGRIVLPQVVKRITPAMGNEIITLVKDTSLASVIGISEIIMTAKGIVATSAIIWPLFYTAVFYLVMCGVLTLVFKAIEKRMNYYKV